MNPAARRLRTVQRITQPVLDHEAKMGIGQLEILAPMLVLIVLTLTIGTVTLLKPLSRRLGDLLEAMAQERKKPQLDNEVEHIRELLDMMSGRLSLLEERQDFTDALMNDPERMRLRSGGTNEGSEAAG